MEARKEKCSKKEVVPLSAVLRDRGRSDCFTELSFLVNKSTRRASRPQGAEMTAKGEGSLVLWCPSSSTWLWRPGLNCFRSLYHFDFVSLSKVRQFSLWRLKASTCLSGLKETNNLNGWANEKWSLLLMNRNACEKCHKKPEPWSQTQAALRDFPNYSYTEHALIPNSIATTAQKWNLG